jgi:hypothetical protein
MQLNDVLIDAFGRVKEEVHGAVAGLNTDDLAFRPSDSTNSIAWLIWHLTRIQGAHLASAMNAEQVWTRDGWARKFKLPIDDSDTGYGHSSSDVASVRASAKLLLGYHDAVHEQSIAYIQKLAPEDYDAIVDKRWSPPVTMAVRLISVISDDLQHTGQAAYVRGMLKPH